MFTFQQQNSIALNNKGQGYAGDLYRNDAQVRFLVHSSLGMHLIDEEATQERTDGYLVLLYSEDLSVLQSIKPGTEDFLYHPNPLRLIDTNATLYSPETKKRYEAGFVYEFYSLNGNKIHFYKSSLTGGNPVRIDRIEEEGNALRYRLLVINRYPVIQHIYPVWGDVYDTTGLSFR